MHTVACHTLLPNSLQYGSVALKQCFQTVYDLKLSLFLICFWASTVSVNAQVYSSTSTIQNVSNGPTGNVGIGTGAPEEKLHVNGSIRGNGAGGQLRISTLYGTLDLGARNSSWSHIETDRPLFYVNKSVHVNGALSSYNTDLVLQTEGIDRLTLLKTNGYAGFGTASPAAKVHINSGVARESLRVYLEGNTTNYVNIWQGSAAGVIEPVGTGRLFVGYDYSTDIYLAHAGGKVGIGTSTPSHQLSIQSSVSEALSIKSNSHTILDIKSGEALNAYLRFSNTPALSPEELRWDIASEAGGNLRFFNYKTGQRRMVITESGSVGIGTETPGSFKLAVNGKIWTQEVNVQMTNPGPDYVFEPTYNLTPLSEVETYIKANKHLPEVPSAKEMEEEGLNLKEMNLLLLKKVEELTLHLIEMKKENELQSREIESLKTNRK